MCPFPPHFQHRLVDAALADDPAEPLPGADGGGVGQLLAPQPLPPLPSLALPVLPSLPLAPLPSLPWASLPYLPLTPLPYLP